MKMYYKHWEIFFPLLTSADFNFVSYATFKYIKTTATLPSTQKPEYFMYSLKLLPWFGISDSLNYNAIHLRFFVITW